jgi:protein O-mannosyl-transferase
VRVTASSRALKNSTRLAAIVLICAGAFAVYSPSLKNDFVWDDTALVLRDPFIRSWRLIPEGFRHFLFTDATTSNFYRPLQRLTYTLDYALYGFQPWGWHLTNIALHAAAAAMLFLFVEKLIASIADASGSRSLIVPGFVAMIWAVHPVHTSGVCYVAGRADLLAVLFAFAGLRLALNAASAANTIAAGACFFAAMLSKESGVTVLLVCGLLSFARLVGVYIRTYAGQSKFSIAVRKLGFVGFGRCLFASILVLAAYFSLRFCAEKIEPPKPEPTPIAVRPILMARAFAEYAGLLIAPVNLHMERNVVAINHGNMHETLRAARLREFQTLLGLVLIGGFVAWCVWAKRKNRLAFFALLAFAAAYLPVSNIVPLNATAAEHWLYFPSAFLILAAVASAASLASARVTRSLAVIAAVWIVFLGTRTFVRNFDWKDQRTFFEQTVRAGGDSARMFVGLGLLESSAGNYAAATDDFKKALQRAPDQAFALLGFANVCIRSNDFTHARALLERSQRNEFVRAESLAALAVLEYRENKTDRIDLLREAVRLSPHNWDIRKRYIKHLDERGDTTEAIGELRTVLDRQWWRADSWKLLGDLLVKIGRRELAKSAYTQAAAYDVRDAEARAKAAGM